MRALVVFAIGGVILAALCMFPAVIGRAMDWSAFALVLSGAVLGVSFGIAATIYLYVTGTIDLDAE